MFTPDKKLLMSLGGAYMYAGYGEYAQDPSVHLGKLLRLNDDGTPLKIIRLLTQASIYLKFLQLVIEI